MRKIAALTLAVVTGLLCLLPAHAQPRPRSSPHETISQVIDGNRITIVYGRPYSKHPRTGEMRKIWGGLVPHDKVWRTGADEATLLITQKQILLGDTAIPAGVYTLWTLPAADGSAQLIVNKQVGHWGTQYDHEQDFARVEMQRSELPESLDQFTMALEPDREAGGGVLKLMWEKTLYSVPIKVQP